ncbi:MAG: HD domain-containing protein [Clostridiales bacterium]|nr:HD domain-containing protein [Clostridiales bacterium]
MLEFIRTYQTYVMLCFSAICLMLAILAGITKTLPRRRKGSLIYIELSASLLVFFDRLSYIYIGNLTGHGLWMMKFSNFNVFLLTILFLHAVNLYIQDLALTEMGLKTVPMRIRVSNVLVLVGMLLISLSQFNGFYYYFDELNQYHRGPGFAVSYVVPFVIIALQTSFLVNYGKRLKKGLRISMALFVAVPIIASVIQFYSYGLSLINIAVGISASIIYVFAIKDMNDQVDKEKRQELDAVEAERNRIMHGFDEAATAIASAVDARDEYTRGHSVRVAKYARIIAERAGLDENACREVHYAALLHDVGKISVPDSIIRKGGAEASESDKAVFRQHAEYGAQMMATITDYPYLTESTKYHHENYDGTGYPDGLMGDHIPLYARIVKVADVYDAMTSHKKHRGPYPQGKVREKFISGSQKLFDPKFAAIMVEMIDEDTDYKMRESEGDTVIEVETVSYDLKEIHEMKFGEYKETVSDGIKLSPEITKLSFTSVPEEGAVARNSLPSLIVFDSFDGAVHTDERKIRNLHYFEFGEIWVDGNTISTRARNMNTEITPVEGAKVDLEKPVHYEVEAVRFKDHVKIKITCPDKVIESTIALLESARSVYVGLAGEHCLVTNIKVDETGETIDENYIPRISREVEIINLADGDIPNVQIDEYRSVTTEGIQVNDGMRLLFHTKTLPASEQVSCCPYILLYTSDDGKPDGRNYNEYACIRLDGDDVTNSSSGHSTNDLSVKRKDDFIGWDAWKQYNQKGYECEVTFKRRRNAITLTTENAGVDIKCVTPVPKETEVYVALTGNRCALMDIRSLD